MPRALCALLLLWSTAVFSQDYFLKNYEPYIADIPSPETYLGYGIGEHHTRHDRIVGYLEALAKTSDRAQLYDYGKTHEGRRLVILMVSSKENLSRLDELKQQHLEFTDPSKSVSNYNDVPVFINLAYNVHGNEPSSSEAAMLTAYTLTTSQHPEIQKYLENAILFIDPTINPDGRDRHTQWATTYQGSPLVADPQDAEHNEYWPGGRTNHYWFDLNRDWLLGINPESRGKLNWYHQWYPNVVTDFHEMGTQSTYFFEPMKVNGSLNPIMPKENYEDLNNLFGEYFSKALDSIGSLYFTKEVFDGTYPGYGSSYPDLQGGLGLLFEQASSRGHKQKTPFGEITFPFTIRNQYVSSITTVKAAVENKSTLRKYQQDFFKSALTNASKSKIRAYRFGDAYDANRLKAFVDKLLLHRVEVYRTDNHEYVVPTRQPQYRMVQTFFETYDEYRDSVYYDASAWSVANFYNMKYRPVSSFTPGEKIMNTQGLTAKSTFAKSDYAYIIDGDDYNTIAALHALQQKELVLSAAFKPFNTQNDQGTRSFNYGAMVLPVALQKKSPEEVHMILKEIADKFEIPVYSVSSGYHSQGIDLGSRFIKAVHKPKAAMLIGQGTRAYEAGEVWHLLDTRVGMPITKIPLRNFKKADLSKYNVLVMISGNYELDEKMREKIADWVKKGNTLITIGTASKWAVEKEMVKEKLTKIEKDTTAIPDRKPYVDSGENLGKESVGGIIVRIDLDRTHPIGFGYHDSSIPVYKNNTVWLKPSLNEYATVAKYPKNPMIDGFITDKNKADYLEPSASIVVSELGKGRVVLFADNPNFRGSWYGTNRLFLNAIFLGDKIEIPKRRDR